MQIPLHRPFWGKKEEKAVVEAIRTTSGVGDGPYGLRLREKLKKLTGARFVLPVTSCTHGMEMAIAALGVKAGDEVIIPSFTLSSTALGFTNRGAKPVFADIDPHTYCLDPDEVEKAITKRTRGIMVVHYAGMAHKIEKILGLAKKYHLWVVEDAAHCIGSYYHSSTNNESVRIYESKQPNNHSYIRHSIRNSLIHQGQHLGTFGDAGAFSFHGTKNIACGEGGAVVTNDGKLADKMEIYRAMGTNRPDFLRGKASLYHWVGQGTSAMLSDILAALLLPQLDQITKNTKLRCQIASFYHKLFQPYTDFMQLPIVPPGVSPNWHIYALKFRSVGLRKQFIRQMRKAGIEVSTHFVPLHTSPMGLRWGGGKRKLPVTEEVAETLVRMPIYAGLTEKELKYIALTARRVLERIK